MTWIMVRLTVTTLPFAGEPGLGQHPAEELTSYATFSGIYADQAELDHAAFKDAIRQGRIEVQAER